MPSTPIPSTPIPSTPVNIFLLYFVFIFSEKCNFFFRPVRELEEFLTTLTHFPWRILAGSPPLGAPAAGYPLGDSRRGAPAAGPSGGPAGGRLRRAPGYS